LDEVRRICQDKVNALAGRGPQNVSAVSLNNAILHFWPNLGKSLGMTP
jgi:hypothetical protein